jgi:hypothetical protein
LSRSRKGPRRIGPTNADITESVIVPEPAVVRTVYVRNRALDGLRRTLFDATNDVRFAKEWDALEVIRTGWYAQQVARERIFSHVLAPTQRPKSEPAPWQAQAARLSALRSVDHKEAV